MRIKRILSSNIVKNIFKSILFIFIYLLLIEFFRYFYRNEIRSNKEWEDVFKGIYALYNVFALLIPIQVERVIVIMLGLVIATLFLFLNKYFDMIYFLIIHKSFKEGQYSIKEKSVGYKVIEQENLDLSYHFSGLSDQTSLIKAIEEQDIQLSSVKLSLNNKTLGYLGIAHTPLIARAGYIIGDGINVALFHKKRTFKEYELLKSEKQFPDLLIKTCKLTENSNELVVVVSTTFEVIKEELSILDIESKNLIYFETDKKDYDVLFSINQIDNYVAIIMSKIRQVTKTQHISKIHMILSTSVALTFKLGQAISENNDPEVIFYHYDINSKKKYIWGVQIKKNSQDCVVMM